MVPDPEALFLAFKTDLERVGFRVVGRQVGPAEIQALLTFESAAIGGRD